MKTIKNIILILLALPLLITSCKKEGRLDAAIEDSMENKANIRLYNFSIGSPSANFYSNEQKISGTLSATGSEAIAGVSFGGTYPTNQYALAPLGQREIKMITPSSLPTGANLVIASVTHNFVDQKYYSIFTSGIYDPITIKSEAFVVEDNFPAEFDPLNAYIRIVNPGHNTTAGITMVLQKSTTVNGVKTITAELPIGTAIAYKQASPFVLSRPAHGNYW